MRIVGALSGDPQTLCKTVSNLKEQIHQLDEIYYSTPDDMSRVPSGVTVVKLPDNYHRLNPLIGPLLKEQDPNVLIILFEPDVVYPTTLVRDLYLNHLKYPQAALGSAGWRLGSFPFYLSGNFNQNPNNYWFNLNYGSQVDLLTSYPGILVKRDMFPEVQQIDEEFLGPYLKSSRNMKSHADVYLSAYLCSRNIARVLVYCDSISTKEAEMYPSRNLVKSIQETQELKLLTEFEQVSLLNTITGPLVLFFIFMLMFMLVVIMILR